MISRLASHQIIFLKINFLTTTNITKENKKKPIENFRRNLKKQEKRNHKKIIAQKMDTCEMNSKKWKNIEEIYIIYINQIKQDRIMITFIPCTRKNKDYIQLF